MTLRRFNNLLTVVVIGLCLYVIAAPLWPNIAHRFKSEPPLVAMETQSVDRGDKPQDNTLVIPGIKLQEIIHGGGEESLNKGIWHTPGSSTPGSGGNTVLSGHRFTYGGQAVLYHMDKVRVGDPIVIYWRQKRYEYTVKDTFVVSPARTEILDHSETPLLTIYTCTPLVTATHRLVIQAELKEVEQ